MMKEMLFLAATVVLAGCGAMGGTPFSLEGNALKQVRAGLAQDDGEIKFANAALWLPHSKEFKFDGLVPAIGGNVVITEKSFLFQQWGGSTGLTTIKRISIADVRDASIIEFGLSRMVVIRTNSDQYDSFQAMGEYGNKTATIQMYEAISALIEKTRAQEDKKRSESKGLGSN